MPDRKFDSIFIFVYLYLLLLCLIKLIPYSYPDARTWGFNHHTYLPDFFQIIFFAFAGITLIYPFVDRRFGFGDRLLKLFSQVFFEHRFANYIHMTIMIPALLIFYFNPQTTHFLGDGYEAIDILSRPDPFILKFSQTGAIWFYETIRAMIGPETRNTAEMTFRIVPAVMGALYIFLTFKIAGIMAENYIKRTLIWATSVFSGILLMFLGYAEFYAPVIVLSLLYIYFGINRLKKGKYLIWAVIIFLVGLSFHLIFLFYTPSLLVLLFSKGKGRAYYDKYNRYIYITLSAFVIAGLAGFVYLYQTSLLFENMMLPPFSGKPAAPDYGIFTPNHLLDIFNEIVLIFPMLVMFLILGMNSCKNNFSDHSLRFLGLAAFGFIPFLFLVDPQLSMARDWDLFSMALIPIMLFSILIVPAKRIMKIQLFIIQIVLICILFGVSFLTLHLDRKKSVEYFENLIDMNVQKSLSSISVLTDYYVSRGQNFRADSLREIFQRKFTNQNLISESLNRIAAGDIDGAFRLIPNIKPDKFNADYHRLRANIYALNGNNRRALEEIGNALELRPRAPVYYFDRARMYFAVGDMENAKIDLYHGYKLAPESNYFLDGLSYYYMAVRNYDSTLKYAHLWRESDTTQPNSFYYLAKASALKGDRKTAGEFYDSLMMFPRDDSLINLKRSEIKNLLNK